MPHHHHDRQPPFDDLDDGHDGEAGIPAKAGMRHPRRRSCPPYRRSTLLRGPHASVSPARRLEGLRRTELALPLATPGRPRFGAHFALTSGGVSTCRGSTSNPASRQPASPPLRGWTSLYPWRASSSALRALVASLGSAQ